MVVIRLVILIVCQRVSGRQRVAILSPKESSLWHLLKALGFVELKLLKNGKRLCFLLPMARLPQTHMDQLMCVARRFRLNHTYPVTPGCLPSRPQLDQSVLEILESLLSRTYLYRIVLTLSVNILFIFRKSGGL
jgi:hypothetical protein